MNISSQLESTVESFVELFERIGVCVAMFVGAAAIVHFRQQVVPFCPGAAVAVGFLLMVSSLLLSIFVAGIWFSKNTGGIQSKLALATISVLVVTTTIFFLIAGFYASVSSLKA